jgi:hypothetical protein
VAAVDEPNRDGAVIVFHLGKRFPASGVSVCSWGQPATRKTHNDVHFRRAWCSR